MWDWPGLRHINGIPGNVHSGRHDITECLELTDVAVLGYPQHSVVMTVGNQKATAVLLDGPLDTRRKIERCVWRIGRRIRAKVGYDRITIGSINTVYAINSPGAEQANQSDQHVTRTADERDINSAADADD